MKYEDFPQVECVLMIKFTQEHCVLKSKKILKIAQCNETWGFSFIAIWGFPAIALCSKEKGFPKIAQCSKMWEFLTNENLPQLLRCDLNSENFQNGYDDLAYFKDFPSLLLISLSIWSGKLLRSSISLNCAINRPTEFSWCQKVYRKTEFRSKEWNRIFLGNEPKTK